MDRNLFDQVAVDVGATETAADLETRIAAYAAENGGPRTASYAIGAFYAIVQLVWTQRDPGLSALQFLAILQRHAADAIDQPEAA